MYKHKYKHIHNLLTVTNPSHTFIVEVSNCDIKPLTKEERRLEKIAERRDNIFTILRILMWIVIILIILFGIGIGIYYISLYSNEDSNENSQFIFISILISVIITLSFIFNSND